MSNVLSLIDIAGSERNWERYKRRIEQVIPAQFKRDKIRYLEMYTKIANDLLRNEKVTNKRSILTAMYDAPALGLNPDPIFGHIYFIPYKGVVTRQIGYKGMIQMSYNTGNIRNVRSNLVYEKDEFDYWEDEKGQHYIHRPKFVGDRGKELCGYSIFEDSGGYNHFHIMETAHIEGIKKLVLARMKNTNTPWNDPLFEPEMRKKTVIRRHWKTEPQSAEIAEAITVEEQTEEGIVMTPEDIEHKVDEIIEAVNEPEVQQIAIDKDFVSKL